MSWTDTQEAVRQAVAAAMSLPDRLGLDGVTTIREVEWKRRSAAGARWTATERVDLLLGGVATVGDGETRREFDEDEDGLIVRQGGSRLFDVRVTVNSRNQEPGSEAVGEVSRRLRAGIRAPRVLDILRAESVALVDVGDTQEMDYRDVNDRWQSAGLTVIRFGTTDVWEDSEIEPYIGSVTGTLTLTGGAAPHTFPINATT